MKRAGFTMIELIFVIVILGILSAVALPKFIGVSEQAQVGKLKAYVGTVNRTVSPALWAESIGTADAGKVGKGTKDYSTDLVASLPNLAQINSDGTDLTSPDLTKCAASTVVIGKIGTAKPKTGTVTTVKIGSTTYNVGCVDGSITSAPQFWLDDNTNIINK